MAISAAQLEVSFRATGANETVGAINRVDNSVKQATGGFDAFFDSIQGGAGRAMRALDGISQAMGSIALVGGVTLLAGGARDAFNQVSAIEQATFAMSAYGDSAAEVQDVLNDLTRYAQDASRSGGIFWSEDLYNAAQQLIIVGVELENVSEYVQIMSRAVGLGTVSFDELARVLQRVGAAGRITGTDFDMLRQWGFQLDEQLRNTNVTWEELFDNLDRGIPADALLGQADTIQGAFLYLRGAIVNLGQEFLGVTEDMEFAAGSLGERIVQGLQAAPDAIRAFGDAAANLGDTIVSVIDFVTNMVNAFRMLPDPIQSLVTSILKLVTAFGALRVAGRSLGLITGLMGMGGIASGIGNLVGRGGLFRGGAASATGFGASLASLVGRINPVGLAITGLVGVGGYLVNSFMENKAATEEWEASLLSLDDTLERLRRRGDTELANRADELRDLLQATPDRHTYPTERQYVAQRIQESYGLEYSTRYLEEGWIPEQQGQMEGWLQDWWRLATQWEEVQKVFSEGSEEFTRFNEVLNDALSDSTIDVDAWMTDLTELIETTPAEDLVDAFREFLDIPLSNWAYDAADGMDGLDESAQRVGATLEDISEIFDSLPGRLRDLRLDGLHQEADQIERLAEVWERAFVPQYRPDEGFGLGAPVGEMNEMIDDLDVEKVERLGENWNRVEAAIASGDFDNARLLSDVMSIIGDDSLSLDERAREIDRLVDNLHEYLTVNRDILDLLGQGDLTSMLNLAGVESDAIAAAAGINQVAASMDTLFRVVVGNTNAIGSQFEALFNWADDLIAEEGVWSKLDDLLAAGRISGEHGVFTGDSEYAQAQQAYNSILEDNLAIQEHILTIQAKQAPLLAANASAMEEYMGAIADMPVDEQLAALGFMDAGLQSQLGTVIELAGQFNTMGAEGEAGFRAMAEGIAMTNPALFAMMEQIGLVTDVVRDSDGTVLSFEINLDGAESVQDSLNDLIESIDALTLALGGIPPVRVDTSEIDPAIEKLNALADAARNAMQAGLGNIGAGGNNSARTGRRDAGAETWGNTGVPVVTGLPQTGTGTVQIVADDTAAAEVIEGYQARDGEMLAQMYAWVLGRDDTAEEMRQQWADREGAMLSQMYTWVLGRDDAAEEMRQRWVDFEGANLANMYVWVIGRDDAATEMVSRWGNYDGAILATSYVDVVTRRIDPAGSASGLGRMIRGYADGGYVNEPIALVGERGPELVSLPRGSYVHTNAETMRMMNSGKGGGQGQGGNDNSIHVSFDGATFSSTNREEMNKWAEEDLIPGIARAVGDRRTGMGAAV